MNSKVNVKSNYKIKSVTKELRLKENKYEPYDYILYKVTSRMAHTDFLLILILL